jgi:hypothetical protein
MISMRKARLVLEPMSKLAGTLQLSAALQLPNGSEERLWWQLPEEFSDSVTPWADPWLIGMIFPIMQAGAPVQVEGRVSPSLMANLELFMRIWERWEPGRYRAVDLSATEEVELPPAREPNSAIASLSCGVDSCFTLFRHARRLAGRRSQRIAATVVQHGFDVWLHNKGSDEVFERLLADARELSRSLGLPCIPMKTNFQQMRLNWSHAWGTQIACGFHLLAGRYDTALTANDMPYQWMGMAWPSHPVTNPLLGSKGFALIDDGGEFSRSEKAKLIADWPEAMRRLHVCFGLDQPGTYQNCCTCEKCVRTILAFRIAACARPAAFLHDPSDAEIRRVRLHLITRVRRWEQLARGAEAAGLGQTGWAKAVRSVLRKHRMRQFRNRIQRPFIPIRNAIRRAVRGTELSRREIADKDR